MKNKHLLIVLLITIIINYVNVFQNDFAWDDEFFIVNNIQIRDMKNIPSFFSEPSPGNLYRPLRSTFYTLNYQIWNLNTFGYHLNSILLHFFVTILILYITLNLTNKNSLAFITALFFAAHPIHTERITNMTAAFDVLGILFFLLSFSFYILYSKSSDGQNNLKNNKYFIASVIFYLLALFSSEEAITLIPILLLYDFTFNHKISFNNFKLLLKKYLPYIVISSIYLIIRFSVLGQIGRGAVYFHESLFLTLLIDNTLLNSGLF